MAKREIEPIITLTLIAIALFGIILNTAIPAGTIFRLIAIIAAALAVIMAIVITIKYFRYRAGKRILLKKRRRPV